METITMSELPLDDAPGDVTAAAHNASRGHVVYLTEHGERLAVIVPAEFGPQQVVFRDDARKAFDRPGGTAAREGG
jgi:hypothetical protein